jgi:TatA/E family protein of Tat protein translocase
MAGDGSSVSALIVIALVLLLLYGGDRLGTVGKGLGEGVKAFRRTLRESSSTVDESPPPPRVTSIEQAAPKLLPAKGESGPASSGSDDERH